MRCASSASSATCCRAASKLAPEDVWDGAALRAVRQARGPAVLRPDQGAARRRASAPHSSSGVVKDAFASGSTSIRRRATRSRERAIIARAATASRRRRRSCARRSSAGPALPGKLADCTSAGSGAQRTIPGRRRFRRRLGQAGARPRVPGHHAAARQDPEHLGSRSGEVLASQEVHDISVAIGVDPGSERPDRPALPQDLHPRRRRFRRAAHRHADLCACSCGTFRQLVRAGHVYVAMPPLYRIDVGKEVLLRAGRGGAPGRARPHRGARR